MLHVAHAWPPAGTGGTERYAAGLAAAQEALGAEVRHWTGAELPRGRGFRASWDSPAHRAAFCALLARWRPDVVHVHHLAGADLAVPVLARASGARVVLTLHDAWTHCARGQLVDADAVPCEGPSEAACARCLAPALWAPAPARAAARLPARRGAVRARALAASDAVAAAHACWVPAVHLAERLGVRATHVPLPLLAPVTPAPPAPSGPLRVAWLGHWIPTKGPQVLLEAWARLRALGETRGMELHLAGVPARWQGTEAWAAGWTARARATPGVHVHGPLPHEAVASWLAARDVLAFPSTWMENSPFVLREAGAAGVRILASDVPGARAVAPQARLVPPGDVEAWADALVAERTRGRARVPPVGFPDMASHAADVLARYVALLG
ncbi:MAG: hypothetical protein RLZZ299_1743 [Pseudomonadota bacterium]